MTPMQIDFGDSSPERVIGIDLGTTNSLVAYMDLTAPKIIPGEDGQKLVPSVVSLTRSGEIVVGNQARVLLINEPDRTIYSVKRLMGRGVADVQDELKLFPFRIAPDSDSVIRVQLGEKTFTPIIAEVGDANFSVLPGTPVENSHGTATALADPPPSAPPAAANRRSLRPKQVLRTRGHGATLPNPTGIAPRRFTRVKIFREHSSIRPGRK